MRSLRVFLVLVSVCFCGVSCSTIEPDGATQLTRDYFVDGASPLGSREVQGSAPDMSNRGDSVRPGGPVRWKMTF